MKVNVMQKLLCNICTKQAVMAYKSYAKLSNQSN